MGVATGGVLELGGRHRSLMLLEGEGGGDAPDPPTTPVLRATVGLQWSGGTGATAIRFEWSATDPLIGTVDGSFTLPDDMTIDGTDPGSALSGDAQGYVAKQLAQKFWVPTDNLVYNSQAPQHTDYNGDTGGPWYYRAVAINDGGESAPSNVVEFKPQGEFEAFTLADANFRSLLNLSDPGDNSAYLYDNGASYQYSNNYLYPADLRTEGLLSFGSATLGELWTLRFDDLSLPYYESNYGSYVFGPQLHLLVAALKAIPSGDETLALWGDADDNYVSLRTYQDRRDGLQHWALVLYGGSGVDDSYTLLATDALVDTAPHVFALDFTDDPQGTVLHIDDVAYPFVAWQGNIEQVWHSIAVDGWPDGWWTQESLQSASDLDPSQPASLLANFYYAYWDYASDFEGYFDGMGDASAAEFQIAHVRTIVNVDDGELGSDLHTLDNVDPAERTAQIAKLVDWWGLPDAAVTWPFRSLDEALSFTDLQPYLDSALLWDPSEIDNLFAIWDPDAATAPVMHLPDSFASEDLYQSAPYAPAQIVTRRGRDGADHKIIVYNGEGGLIHPDRHKFAFMHDLAGKWWYAFVARNIPPSNASNLNVLGNGVLVNGGSNFGYSYLFDPIEGQLSRSPHHYALDYDSFDDAVAWCIQFDLSLRHESTTGTPWIVNDGQLTSRRGSNSTWRYTQDAGVDESVWTDVLDGSDPASYFALATAWGAAAPTGLDANGDPTGHLEEGVVVFGTGRIDKLQANYLMAWLHRRYDLKTPFLDLGSAGEVN